MGKLLFLAAVLLFVFSALAAEVSVADVSLGVKPGDWIEYAVSTTGVPSEGHDVVWARMEVLSVSHGEVIAANTTTKAVNGSFSSLVMTLDPASGQVDIWAIIPADLSKGSSFYDKNLGNIPIMGEEHANLRRSHPRHHFLQLHRTVQTLGQSHRRIFRRHR